MIWFVFRCFILINFYLVFFGGVLSFKCKNEEEIIFCFERIKGLVEKIDKERVNFKIFIECYNSNLDIWETNI